MYLAKEESFGPIMVLSKFDAGDVEGVVIRYLTVECEKEERERDKDSL